MKKKIIAIMFASIISLSLVACGNDSKSSTKTDTVKKENNIDITKLDAESIINLYKDAGFPLENIIVYNEENDVNELLGRPNQYTSKINFADTRYEQSDPANPVGGSIEVFGNENDANSRLEYCKSLAEQSSMFAEYDYVYKNILLRIHKPLTPTHAAEYEEFFKSLSEGKQIEFAGQLDTTSEKDNFNIDNLSFDLEITKSDSWVQISGSYTNNSKYTITQIIVSYLDTMTNTIVYYGSYDTVLPGETSPLSEGDTIDNMNANMENMKPTKYQINATDSSNNEISITYDAKLDKYTID